jgi:hypothetical protein
MTSGCAGRRCRFGAKAKDAVENALHHEVCAGTLTPLQAQNIIATDWFEY